eukprot:CAMPEP_0117762458 /NCGR_PEP_ID=MMETSP0947-20121206/17948_1 /TAXON_ID=44440 /ORGANISM="Chattonella subsalsa, Strain CCMP2191" /LENGTH=411 /DNA_ID=CAMNT_0005583765 /DNA_START=280 /DNA_END=1515 /DNA_ORIENTATION=-
MIYYCLLPCLLFTAIASNVNMELLKSVYILPIFGMLVPLIGVGLGLAITRVMPKTEKFGWRQAVSCIGLGNSGYLPLVFVPAVMLMNPFNSTPNEGEANSEMLVRLSEVGMSYVSTYLIGYVPSIWFYGRKFLIYPYKAQNSSKTSEDTLEEKLEGGDFEPQEDEERDSTDPFAPQSNGMEAEDFEKQEIHVFPTVAGQSLYNLRRTGSKYIFQAANKSVTSGNRVWKFVTGHVTEVVCVCAVIFGMITPLQSLFFSSTGEKMAYLEPTITNAMRTLGAAVSPVVTILLGANVLAARKKGSGDNSAVMLPKSIPVICLSGKLILLPIIGTAIVYFLKLAGALGNDPVLIFVLLLQFSPPPAQNLTLMCELANHGQREISTVLFYSYLSAVLTMTAWTTFFIYFINTVLVTQ